MAGYNATLSPDEGAETPVHLTLLSKKSHPFNFALYNLLHTSIISNMYMCSYSNTPFLQKTMLVLI